jgi:hypothetical protein
VLVPISSTPGIAPPSLTAGLRVDSWLDSIRAVRFQDPPVT